MKKVIAFILFNICCWSVSATDLLPNTPPIKGVLHQDTSTHSFRLMVDPIQSKNVEFSLCTRDLEPTFNNLSDIYSFRLYHINKEEITLSISFCSISETGKEIWSIPTDIIISPSKGEYQENSLVNLSSNLNLDLSKISKIKISSSKEAFLDEIEFYYFLKDKNEFKPSMREIKKKLRAEKQKLKNKKSKEYNTIREAEYKDHF